MLREGCDLRPRKEPLTKDISSSRKPIPVGWHPRSVGSSRCQHGRCSGFPKWVESDSSIQFRYQILNAHTYLKSFFFFCSANQSSFHFLISQLYCLFLFYLFYVSRSYFHFEQSPWGQDCSWGILLLGYIRMWIILWGIGIPLGRSVSLNMVKHSHLSCFNLLFLSDLHRCRSVKAWTLYSKQVWWGLGLQRLLGKCPGPSMQKPLCKAAIFLRSLDWPRVNWNL